MLQSTFSKVITILPSIYETRGSDRGEDADDDLLRLTQCGPVGGYIPSDQGTSETTFLTGYVSYT